jgi:hypothetical protein
MKIIPLAATGLLALASHVVQAETLVVNDQVALRQSTVPVPVRGASMKTVEGQFGAPETRHATVGSPPITRWDYAAFSVFFEHDHVIHSVTRAP